MSKKHTGSYYTPATLSDFLVLHIKEKYLDRDIDLSILEPSCGDGQFISSLVNNLDFSEFKNASIDIVDINESELDVAYNLLKGSAAKVKKIKGDYLKHSLGSKRKYNLILGNPPYIRNRNMESDQIDRCIDVHEKAKKYSNKVTSIGSVKNIWPAFIEASIMSLDENGILCFVLPSEILQVKYTRELRDFIRSEFQRVEVFAFNELIFDDIDQDVIALIGIKTVKKEADSGVAFYQVESLADLKEPKFTEKFSNIHRTNLDKWTNYILTDDELDLIHDYRRNLKTIRTYCDKVEVGIVTAANDYFILSRTDIINHNLYRIKNLIKPIIPKGTALPHTLDFTQEDYLSLYNRNERVNFVNFPNKAKAKLSVTENKYISVGEAIANSDGQTLDNRYKMKFRENWYSVPSIWQSDGFFVKRSNLFPKVIVNSASINLTDSFYRINIKSGFSMRCLAFSFYNSLTFCLAELEGRFYGGGVLELTPNEFKDLSIPYTNITGSQFDTLNSMIRMNKSLEDILEYTDSILLTDMPRKSILRLRSIRRKLVDRRLKSKPNDIHQDS